MLIINSLNLRSQVIDEATAKNVAFRFYNSLRDTNELKSVSIQESDIDLINAPTAIINRNNLKSSTKEILYYIFNIDDNKGFVIVSGDKIANPILGYSKNGHFSINDIPPAMNSWLDGYKKEIIYAKENITKPDNKTKKEWNIFLLKDPLPLVAPVVGPLLGSIEWGQHAPYNNLVNDHWAAGCVAIAMGQIMAYYNYPNRGTGLVSYTDPTNSKCTVADPERTQNPTAENFDIDWNAINSADGQQLATLVLNVGVSLNMNYSACGSGASTSRIGTELESHFNYASGSTNRRRRDNAQDWTELLKGEIDAGRPLPYRGTDLNDINNPDDNSGHSFVCDGYDSENKFHFNWGWEGNSNGYFKLTSLDPNNSQQYTTSQAAVFGIKLPQDVHEPNNTESSATLLDYDFSNSIIIGEAGTTDILDDQDYYRVNLPAGSNYKVNARVYEFDHNNPDIFYSGNVNLEYKTDIWHTSTDGYQIPEFEIINGGSVYFKISGNEEPAMHNTGTYGLEITIFKTEMPSLIAGIVSPSQATTDDNVEFSVIYKDESNQPPASVDVIINGESNNMTTTGNNFSEGMKYNYNHKFSSSGSKDYYFEAVTVDDKTIRYPESGALNFSVIQSAAGYDIMINPYDTHFTPSGPKAGDNIDIQVGLRNNDTETYNNVPIKVELRSSDGTLLDHDETTSNQLPSTRTESYILQVQVPSNATDGNYSITCSVYPTLDSDPSNNSLSLSFNIGANLPNDQFRVDNGDEIIDYGKSINIKGKIYTFAGINVSNNYAGFRDQSGDLETIKEGEIHIFKSDNRCIALAGVYDFSGYLCANLYGGYSITSGGAQYEKNIVQAYPGQKTTFHATAPSGYTFDDENHKVWTTRIPSSINSWYQKCTSNDDYRSADFEFSIPDGTPPGSYKFYFMTEYKSDSRVDITCLHINVVEPLPQIDNLSTYYFSADDQIIISGSNFGTSGTIKFNSLISTEVISWSNNSITCVVPENVTSGVLTISNNSGISNSISFKVNSSTGDPVVVYHIPDITINPDETKYIIDLNNVFTDPNNDKLTYNVTSDNKELTIDIQNSLLYIISSENILKKATVTVSATDADGITVSDNFIVNVSPILIISPTTKTVDSSSGTDQFSVHTNTDWNVSENADWLAAVKTDNATISITYDKNTSYSLRSAPITIYSTIDTMAVLFRQEGKINLAPTHISISRNSFPEDFEVGEVMATISVTDPDEGDTHTLELDPSYSNGYFSINGNNLILEQTLDYEIFPTMDIVIIATDNQGATYQQHFELNIQNINEMPVVTSIEIYPENPKTSDDIELHYTCQDPDNGGGSYKSGDIIKWYKNGVLQTELNGLNLITNNKTSFGEQWYATVTPQDNDDKVEPLYGKTVTSNVVKVEDSTFTPTISITNPTLSSNWDTGTSHDITWNDNFDSNIVIELYKGDTYSQTIIASTASDGSYRWAIPESLSAGTNYRIKITDTNSSASDYSEYFTISNIYVVDIYITDGGATIDENSTQDYNCAAFYSDGSIVNVNPTWSENSSFASVNSNGLVTTSSVSSNTSFTLTATFDGKTKTKTITIVNNEQDPMVKYFEQFGITTQSYNYDINWDSIVSAITKDGYRVAEWQDLVNYFNNNKDILILFDSLNMTDYGASVSLKYNEKQFYSSSRSYFATRHEHNKPSSYQAHANIDNYLISLGSWYGSRQILVYNPISTDINSINNKQRKIEVYPNPAKNIIYIKSNNINVRNVKLYNIAGELLFEKNNIQSNTTFNVSNLRKGLYLIVIKTENQVFNYKIIKN